MKLGKNDKPQWFFMWTTGNPYITSICNWTRTMLIQDVQKSMGEKWEKIYRQGGRAVKCDITIVDCRD